MTQQTAGHGPKVPGQTGVVGGRARSHACMHACMCPYSLHTACSLLPRHAVHDALLQVCELGWRRYLEQQKLIWQLVSGWVGRWVGGRVGGLGPPLWLGG